MKWNEIMIGGWYLHKGNPVCIKTIDSQRGKVGIWTTEEHNEISGKWEWVEASFLEGLEITRDIFERLVFGIDKKGFSYKYDKAWSHIDRRGFRFVHKLQMFLNSGLAEDVEVSLTDKDLLFVNHNWYEQISTGTKVQCRLDETEEDWCILASGKNVRIRTKRTSTEGWRCLRGEIVESIPYEERPTIQSASELRRSNYYAHKREVGYDIYRYLGPNPIRGLPRKYNFTLHGDDRKLTQDTIVGMDLFWVSDIEYRKGL